MTFNDVLTVLAFPFLTGYTFNFWALRPRPSIVPPPSSLWPHLLPLSTSYQVLWRDRPTLGPRVSQVISHAECCSSYYTPFSLTLYLLPVSIFFSFHPFFSLLLLSLPFTLLLSECSHIPLPAVTVAHTPSLENTIIFQLPVQITISSEIVCPSRPPWFFPFKCSYNF